LSNTTDQNASSGILVVSSADSGNLFIGNASHNNGGFDMSDFSSCANRWVANAFVTDSEGDGPRAGCIR
jgi:hypothetical protein